MAAEDDLYNRYLVMRITQERSAIAAFALVVLYLNIETASNFIGCLLRLRWDGFWSRLSRTYVRAVSSCVQGWLDHPKKIHWTVWTLL